MIRVVGIYCRRAADPLRWEQQPRRHHQHGRLNRLPAGPPHRLRRIRRGVVGHRPPGRQTGGLEKAAKCFPEPRQLQKEWGERSLN